MNIQVVIYYLFKANKLALRSIQAAFADAASFAVEPKKKVRLRQIVHSSNYEYNQIVHGMFHFFSLSEKESFQKNVKMDTLLLIIIFQLNFGQFEDIQIIFHCAFLTVSGLFILLI